MPHPRQAALTALAQLTTQRLASPVPVRVAGGYPVLDITDALVEVAGLAYAAGDDATGALAERLSKKKLVGRALSGQESKAAQQMFTKYRLHVIDTYGDAYV